MRYDMRNIKETIWYYLECIWNTNCNRNYLKALRHKRTHFVGTLKTKYERNYLSLSEWNTRYKRTHFEGSLHWGGLCISRGTWLRIRCNVPPSKIFVQKLSNWKQKLESQLSLKVKEALGYLQLAKVISPLIIEGRWRIALNLGIPVGFVQDNKFEGVLLTATLTAPLD